jgi:hypothetical protein
MHVEEGWPKLPDPYGYRMTRADGGNSMKGFDWAFHNLPHLPNSQFHTLGRSAAVFSAAAVFPGCEEEVDEASISRVSVSGGRFEDEARISSNVSVKSPC